MVQYEKNKTRLVRLLTSLGDVQMEQENYADAVKYYEKILVLGIEEPMVYSSLSKAFLKLKRYDTQALNIYRKTLQFEPENKEICNLLSQFYLKMNRRDDEAIAIYTKALNLQSVHAVEILPTLIHIYLERNEFSNAIAITQKGIDLPEVREEALKYFVQLSIRLQEYGHAIDVLKRQYKRSRQLPILNAICRLLVEKHRNLTANGEDYILTEEDCDLGLKLLKSDLSLQKSDDVQFFSALAYIIHASFRYRHENFDERSHEYEFFFSDLNPVVVLNHGFSGRVSQEEKELDFFNLLWNRMNKRATLSPVIRTRREATPPEFSKKRPLFGISFKIINFRDLLGLLGAARLKALSVKLMENVTQFLAQNENFHLRFLADGFLGLVPFQSRIIRSAIELMRMIEKMQSKIPANEKLKIIVTLNLLHNESTAANTLFQDLNIMLHLPAVILDTQSTDSDDNRKVFNENLLLISRDLYLKLRELDKIEISMSGDFHIPHLINLHQVYQVEWIDPFDRFKNSVLKKSGRFEIVNTLQLRDTSAVYQGQDDLLERLVLIKVVRETPEDSKNQQMSISGQFFKEMRDMGRLNHRNIMLSYDVATAEGFVYLAREYFEGKNLKVLIQRGKLRDRPRLIRIFIQIASALKYAHQAKMIHQNLKPSNIIVADNDEVKITDFGRATYFLKMKDAPAEAFQDLAYASPEQIMDEEIDVRTDMFSFGVILYEALTHRKPFKGESEMELKESILETIPQNPSEIDPEIPAGFDDIIQKALAKDPDDRYAKMNDLMRAFYSITERDFKRVLPS